MKRNHDGIVCVAKCVTKAAQERLEQIITEQRAKGCKILLVYHDMDFVSRTATAILPSAAATHTRQHEKRPLGVK